jgi:hypothetical protein
MWEPRRLKTLRVSTACYRDRFTSGRMIDELERIWKEAVMAYSKKYPEISLESWGKTRKTSVKLAGVSAEIRTNSLPKPPR